MPPEPQGSALAIDYGRRRLGLAVSDEQRTLAKPLETLERVNRRYDLSRLRQTVREHAVTQVVVGLPLRLDGTEGEMADEARDFAARMEKSLHLPVALVDERLTSWEAQEERKAMAGRPRGPAEHQSSRRGKHPVAAPSKAHRAPDGVDSLAAALILEEYLRRTASTLNRGDEP